MRVVVVPVVVSLLVPEHEGPGASSYVALTSDGLVGVDSARGRLNRGNSKQYEKDEHPTHILLDSICHGYNVVTTEASIARLPTAGRLVPRR